MAALGWLLNLDFAGSVYVETTVPPTTIVPIDAEHFITLTGPSTKQFTLDGPSRLSHKLTGPSKYQYPVKS